MVLHRLSFFLLTLTAGACAIDDRVLSNDSASDDAGTAGSTAIGQGGFMGGGGTHMDAGGGNGSAGAGMGGSAGSSFLDAGSGRGGGGAGGNVAINPLLIDDFEDGDGILASTGGRGGAWFTFNDGTPSGTQTPASGASFMPASPGHNSKYAAHTYGSGFTMFGANLGMNFGAGTTPPFYSIPGYKGISFYAKTPTGTKTIKITISDVNTTPLGKICTTCYDNFGKEITLTTDWAPYTVLFSELKQDGFGVPQTGSLATSAAQGVTFAFPANMSFDFWFDDMYFVP